MAAVENVAGRMVLRTKTKGCKLSTAEEARDYVEAIVSNDIREIHINGISLGVEAGKAIASALEQKENIEVVNLSDIFTGRLREDIPPIMIAFSNALLDKTHLREVDFSDNAYGPDGASSFKELLATNRSIEVLRLNNNGLGKEGGRIVAAALAACHAKNVADHRADSLRVFMAGRNRLENEGATALGNVFGSMRTLQVVAVYQNGIRHEGLEALFQGLKKNENLMELDIQDNTLTKRGSLALQEALPYWKKLVKLNVADCLIGPEGGALLGRSFASLPDTLKELDVGYNELDGQASLAIVKSFENKSALKSLGMNGNEIRHAALRKIKELLEDFGLTKALGSMSDNEGSDESGSTSEEDEEEEDEDEEEDEEQEGVEESPEASLKKIAVSLTGLYLTL